MESFSFNLQAEKTNAILKHQKLQRITGLFRLVEACVVLVLISRLSMKLLVVVRNSSEYLKDFSVFLNSPYFVFLIGNVIIITLFFPGKSVPNEIERDDDIYEKLVQKRRNYEEKERVIKYDSTKEEKMRIEVEQKMKRKVKKSYRRCESEILKKRRRVMRRCESENNREKNVECDGGGGGGCGSKEEEMLRIWYPEDEMSEEEFRQTVEDFIARQQRIQRVE